MLCMDSIARQSYHPLFLEMATCSSLFNSHARSTGWHPLIQKKENSTFSERFTCPTRSISRQGSQLRTCCFLQDATSPPIELLPSDSNLLHTLFDNSEVSGNAEINIPETSEAAAFLVQQLTLADIDPGTAKIAIGLLGPFLSAFGFLFILRIVMSWYPKLPVGKFPYVIAYAPTEPLLVVTRKVIPPLGGVDVTPVVWFGILSFLNEILVGPQGLLVLLSQQVN